MKKITQQQPSSSEYGAEINFHSHIEKYKPVF